MIVKTNQLESMQVYPDIGLMPNDRYDSEERQVPCGYCQHVWIDADKEACPGCLKALEEIN